MRKVLLLLTIFASVLIIFYGVSLILDYMVTSKYHLHDEIQDKITYTTKERAKEIAFLNRYFYITIAFAALVLISGLISLFSKT